VSARTVISAWPTTAIRCSGEEQLLSELHQGTRRGDCVLGYQRCEEAGVTLLLSPPLSAAKLRAVGRIDRPRSGQDGWGASASPVVCLCSHCSRAREMAALAVYIAPPSSGRRSMNLRSNEREIVGAWTFVDGRMVADDACARIDHLVARVLREVATAPDGWDRLYRDSADGRLWQHYYPQSHLHGGGPPALICLSEQKAREKYEF